jgi:hypothetical protein
MAGLDGGDLGAAHRLAPCKLLSADDRPTHAALGCVVAERFAWVVDEECSEASRRRARPAPARRTGSGCSAEAEHARQALALLAERARLDVESSSLRSGSRSTRSTSWRSSQGHEAVRSVSTLRNPWPPCTSCRARPSAHCTCGVHCRREILPTLRARSRTKQSCVRRESRSSTTRRCSSARVTVPLTPAAPSRAIRRALDQVADGAPT